MNGDHRNLHELTHSFPTRRSSDLVAIETMEFIAPILLRDIISVYAHLERRGRTSMGIRIEVVATRDGGRTEERVTEGLFTFVALDENHRPRALPPAS